MGGKDFGKISKNIAPFSELDLTLKNFEQNFILNYWHSLSKVVEINKNLNNYIL